jgi:MoaA/NifB/PqqE/SkfB family radical SAM enzyme
MLNTVLPFPFTLWQPKTMANEGSCEFYLKLTHSPTAQPNERFVPLILSWNVTRECNMKCSHSYIQRNIQKNSENELTTEEAKNLIDQIRKSATPANSYGGEPMLRADI